MPLPTSRTKIPSERRRTALQENAGPRLGGVRRGDPTAKGEGQKDDGEGPKPSSGARPSAPHDTKQSLVSVSKHGVVHGVEQGLSLFV